MRSSDRGAMVASDIKSGPASSELRGRGRPTEEVIVDQVTSFRPGNGTAYKSRAAV